MPLRIEMCDSGFMQWDFIHEVPPGQAHVLDQILEDGDKVYLASCEESDNESIIYESIIPISEFNKKIIKNGVHLGEDIVEHTRIQRGESYKFSLKISDQYSRRVFRFTQE